MIEIDVKQICQVLREAGELFLNREAAAHTQLKGRADFVTEVDFSVQQYICEKLQALYPQVQFLSEEKVNDDVDRKGLMWVLDPVDGTTNLIHDYHTSAISLALMEKGVTKLGVIYNPYRNEMFTAEEGKGIFLNGRQVWVSGALTMEESLIAVGTSPYYKEMMHENFRVFEKVCNDCVDIRRSGSAALDLADVACGRIEAYFEKRLKIWDFAAGMLLVKEAGGVIAEYDGSEVRCDMVEDIVAGTPAIVQQLTERYL